MNLPIYEVLGKVVIEMTRRFNVSKFKSEMRRAESKLKRDIRKAEREINTELRKMEREIKKSF